MQGTFFEGPLGAQHSAWAAACLFGAMALVAACFVTWPVWRARGRSLPAKALLSLATMLFVVGFGGGAYLLVGSPDLAARAFAPPEAGGVPGLIAELARRMRNRPDDFTGWTLLGRGYLSLNDSGQAAVAFRHAAEIAPSRLKPELLSSYGEALAIAAGTVTPEAEAAFAGALAANPKDFAARFYLGQAYAGRHDATKARALWESLLADSPATAPWRANLIDRLAALRSGEGPAPDIQAMVAGLAARLSSRPDDPSGWERLVQAYVVLGEEEKARSALHRARAAMAAQPKHLAALETEARALKLER